MPFHIGPIASNVGAIKCATNWIAFRDVLDEGMTLEKLLRSALPL